VVNKLNASVPFKIRLSLLNDSYNNKHLKCIIMKETSSPACVNCQSSQSDKSGTCVCKECNELFATEENPIGITPFATDISILPIKAENNKSSMTAHKSSVCDNVRFDDNQKSTDPSNPLVRYV